MGKSSYTSSFIILMVCDCSTFTISYFLVISYHDIFVNFYLFGFFFFGFVFLDRIPLCTPSLKKKQYCMEQAVLQLAGILLCLSPEHLEFQACGITHGLSNCSYHGYAYIEKTYYGGNSTISGFNHPGFGTIVGTVVYQHNLA